MKTIMCSIKAINKEYELNHKRWQEARIAEDESFMKKHKKIERLLREANDVLKKIQTIKYGFDSFLPKDLK